jgi:hypothetical protein
LALAEGVSDGQLFGGIECPSAGRWTAAAPDNRRVWCYPYGTVDYRDERGERAIAVRGIEDGEIWVNAQGRRFHDESKRGGATGTPAVFAQTPPTCWAIFDRLRAQRLTLADPYYRVDDVPHRERVEWFLGTSPFVWRADSFASLAEAVGLPRDSLVETMVRASPGGCAMAWPSTPTSGATSPA